MHTKFKLFSRYHLNDQVLHIKFCDSESFGIKNHRKCGLLFNVLYTEECHIQQSGHIKKANFVFPC